MKMQKLAITWHGHSTFVITTPGGKRIVTDPFLEQNPVCPPNMKKITAADLILVSHGHADHTSDVPGSVARHQCADRGRLRTGAVAGAERAGERSRE